MWQTRFCSTEIVFCASMKVSRWRQTFASKFIQRCMYKIALRFINKYAVCTQWRVLRIICNMSDRRLVLLYREQVTTLDVACEYCFGSALISTCIVRKLWKGLCYARSGMRSINLQLTCHFSSCAPCIACALYYMRLAIVGPMYYLHFAVHALLYCTTTNYIKNFTK